MDTFGTSKIDDREIEKLIMANFDLRPKGIIKELDLLAPIYRKTAAYGHFGRTGDEFRWEKTNKVDALTQ